MADIAVDMHVLPILLRQPRLEQRLEQRVRLLPHGERLHQPRQARIAVLEQDRVAQLVDLRHEDLTALSVSYGLFSEFALVDDGLIPAHRGALDRRVLEETGGLDHGLIESRLVLGILLQPLVMVRAIDADRRRRHREASGRGESPQESLLLRNRAHCPIPRRASSRAAEAMIVPPSCGKYRGAK